MKQNLGSIEISTRGPALYSIGAQVIGFVNSSEIAEGLLTCFIRHSSASLVIQENADPDVLRDLEDFTRRLVVRDPKLYRHTAEGPDDMPSHIRAALTATCVSVPVRDSRLALGTWQDLYLFEHRDAPHRREVVLHVIGE